MPIRQWRIIYFDLYEKIRVMNMNKNMDLITLKLDSTLQDLPLWNRSLELDSLVNNLIQGSLRTFDG